MYERERERERKRERERGDLKGNIDKRKGAEGVRDKENHRRQC